MRGRAFDKSEMNAIRWFRSAAVAGSQAAKEALQELSEQPPNVDNFTTRINRDIYGQDIPLRTGQIFIPGIDLNACATECDKNTSCVAFSFDRWEGKCYLKRSVAPLLIDPRSTVGVKKPSNLPPEATMRPNVRSLRNRRFRSVPIDRKVASDFRACQSVCEGELRCVAFSFAKGIRGSPNCQIFNSTEGHYYDESADSGYKYQRPSP
jgi:hypothetical protein